MIWGSTGAPRYEREAADRRRFPIRFLPRAILAHSRNPAKNGKENLVPLVPPLWPGLEKHCHKGLYFTTNKGVSGFSRAKSRLDTKMLELMRNTDPDAVLEPSPRTTYVAQIFGPVAPSCASGSCGENREPSIRCAKMRGKGPALEKWIALVLKLVGTP